MVSCTVFLPVYLLHVHSPACIAARGTFCFPVCHEVSPIPVYLHHVLQPVLPHHVILPVLPHHVLVHANASTTAPCASSPMYICTMYMLPPAFPHHEQSTYSCLYTCTVDLLPPFFPQRVHTCSGLYTCTLYIFRPLYLHYVHTPAFILASCIFRPYYHFSDFEANLFKIAQKRKHASYKQLSHFHFATI
jgi:hypothetical protein